MKNKIYAIVTIYKVLIKRCHFTKVLLLGRQVFFAVMTLLLVVPFQNCGTGFKLNESLTQLDTQGVSNQSSEETSTPIYSSPTPQQTLTPSQTMTPNQTSTPTPTATSTDEDIEVKPTFEGYGKDAKGGYASNQIVKTVTSFADDPTDLNCLRGIIFQYYNSNQPLIIKFAQSGTIQLQNILPLPSSITIDGSGNQIVLKGQGFYIDGKQDIILRNLAIIDVSVEGMDAIQIKNSHDIVIDHVLFDSSNISTKITDESISMIQGSYNVTISYCRFQGQQKVLLFGNGDYNDLDSVITVTLHHNYFNHTGRRHPFLREGIADVYNNLFIEWKFYSTSLGDYYCSSSGSTRITPCAYGIRAQDNGRIMLENNYFQQSNSYLATHAAFTELGGQMKSVGNRKSSGSIVIEDTGWSYTRPYSANIDEVTDSFITNLQSNAGNTL